MSPVSPQPLSIAIPTYNRGNQLSRLLEAVIEQAAPEDELILSDDCSSDGTLELMKRYPRFKVLTHERNLGMVGNWNACLDASTREWRCIIHDDDALARDGLATLRKACALAPGPSLVGHRLDGAEKDAGFRYSVWEPGPWAAFHHPEIPSGAAVHRTVVERMGGFDPRFNYSADLEYFSRILTAFPLVLVTSPPVIHYQYHEDNYQFRTWRQADFYPQFEELQRAVLKYSGFKEGPELDSMLRQRMTGALIYIARMSSSRGDHTTVRHVCRLLSKQRNHLGGRMRLKAGIGALIGSFS